MPAPRLTVDEIAQMVAAQVRTPNPTCPGLDPQTSVVLHTDTDRGLTYTWHDVSPDPQDDGPRDAAVETSLLAVTDRTGTRVARLHISFTTPAFVAATFPRPLAWAEQSKGWCLGFRSAARGYAEPPSTADLWTSAHNHANTLPASRQGGSRSYSLRSDGVPEATMRADLAVLERSLRPQMRAWTRSLATPFVAYAETDPQVRGTGVGRQMYLLAAQHLATGGRVLQASGLQSDLAQSLWGRLAADPAVPTRMLRRKNSHDGAIRTYLCLDYRNAGVR